MVILVDKIKKKGTEWLLSFILDVNYIMLELNL